MSFVGKLKRLWSASTIHKSRLHDMDGNLIPLSRLVKNGPRAVLTGIVRVLFDKRPPLPWISYDGQAEMARRLGKDKRVLEFGAGMSTAWFAAHAKEVVSIEDHEGWHSVVKEKFRSRGIANARIRFAGTKSEYLTLTESERANGFDLVLIDGRFRDDCVDVAIANLNSGGAIYLDNADQIFSDEPNGSCSNARKKLTEWAQEKEYKILTFTDFAPTLFFVTRGEMFIKL